ncbi:MAG: hypothetical protein ACI4RF_08390, partial [Eubacterium sp.]
DDEIRKIFRDDNISDDDIKRKTGSELFPELFSEVKKIQRKSVPDWKIEINDEEDFLKADRNVGCCCIVRDSFLDSYESFQSLEFLLRSMRRASDMIVCCIDNQSRYEDFSYYARQFENLNFRIVNASDNLWQKELTEKYGNPYILRKKLLYYEQIEKLINACMEQKQKLIDEKKELEKKDSVRAEYIRKAEQCRTKINWINRKEVYFREFCELINNDFSKTMAMKGAD